MEIFTKRNHTGFSDALFKEANGLAELEAALIDNEYIKIPKVISVDESILQIEKIFSRPPTKELNKRLGKGVALLHKKEYDNYGFYECNYIGLNPQANALCFNWGEIFARKRLLYQISLISDTGIAKRFEEAILKHKSKIVEFLNENCSHPSLLHGDLWQGNVLFDSKDAWLIDPAVYYGDNEVDIAMSEMFGGFAREFYDSYHEIMPRSKEYEKKKIIYNLYHYLNHYNLFGNSYLSSCENAINFIEFDL